MNLLSDVFHIITNISWTADITALIASVILGIIWFHPAVFGTAWMRLVNLKKEQTKNTRARMAMLYNLPITFIIAANIAAFCKHFKHDTAAEGFLIGYDLGLIICLFLAIHYLYEQRPLKLYAIVAGYTLVSMSIMGMIIGALV